MVNNTLLLRKSTHNVLLHSIAAFKVKKGLDVCRSHPFLDCHTSSILDIVSLSMFLFE
jgi:hypothetical protein